MIQGYADKLINILVQTNKRNNRRRTEGKSVRTEAGKSFSKEKRTERRKRDIERERAQNIISLFYFNVSMFEYIS